MVKKKWEKKCKCPAKKADFFLHVDAQQIFGPSYHKKKYNESKDDENVGNLKKEHT